jgi:hypothetical protein
MPAPRAPKTLLKRTKLPVPFSDMPLRTWYPAACCRLPGQARSHGATVTSGVTTTLACPRCLNAAGRVVSRYRSCAPFDVTPLAGAEFEPPVLRQEG